MPLMKQGGNKILLSGVKPTGKPHLGNYFGMMAPVMSLEKTHDSFLMIADYHALTTHQNKEELKEGIFEVALAYLSLGIDLEKTTLFKQSDVPEHTELAWIFDCITTMPYLMRAHAFKDAEAKNKEISVGTFNYPMLMAADILLYQTNMVPVGGDQKQHVEYAKNTAEKFHRLFGQVFSLPEARILPHVGIVLGTDGRKMSKSYGNTISLFASKEEIGRAVMGMVTDSSGDRPENVYALHALLKPKETLEKLYGENKGNYKALKEALVEDLESFIAPLREKREAFASDRSKVLETLKEGGARAREKANETMKTVRDLIGVNL